jgi:iron(III) transport system ATP-binding protein
MRLADRIALMRHGRLVQVGRADELYGAPVDLFTARFFSEFNEMIAEVRDKSVTTPFGKVPANGFLEGEEIDVCIRPQGIRIETAPGGTAGRILRRRFLGDVDIVDIAVEGLDEPLKARVPGGACAGAGTEVWIHVDPRQILLFHRDNGNGAED